MAHTRSRRSRNRSHAAARRGPASRERILAEASVASDQLRTIIDTIPTLAWAARPDGSAEFFNRRWLDYAGLSTEQALDWGWIEVIHPDDRHTVLQAWDLVIASGAAYEVEARMRRFDAEYRWFLIRANALKDGSGKILKWYGTNTEIEDRRRAEQAVRASEQNLRLIVDSVAGMMCTTAASGELEFVNRQLLEYFGRPLEELRAWQMSDTVHPDDLEHVIGAWLQGMSTGQPYAFEPRLRRADGVYHWFQFRNVPQRDADGRLTRWYGLYVDVDDFKRAEDVSRARERELRLLIDSIPAFLFTMTPACELEQVNRQGLNYFGKTLEELKQWDCIGCVHPDDLPRVRESLQRTIDCGEPHEVEQRLRGADGVYRWFKPRGMALRDAEGRIIRWYCFLSDIDDLRNAEEALRSTQARLSRATHLATVSELSASIAHEVNQPLTAVVANGHACRRWLTAQPANVERALRSADRIVRDGNAAAEVVQRIRSLFQRAPPVKHELSMNDVLTEVCDLMADEFRTHGVALVTSLQADLPRAAADRVQMQQVVFNLVRNGIEAAADVAGRKQLSIHSRSQGEEILVHVTDTGAGIGNPDAIFEPFYTTKPSGMGMGLAVCRSIIEAHGGRLWAAPNLPAGSTFSFALKSVAREAG